MRAEYVSSCVFEGTTGNYFLAINLNQSKNHLLVGNKVEED